MRLAAQPSLPSALNRASGAHSITWRSLHATINPTPRGGGNLPPANTFFACRPLGYPRRHFLQRCCGAPVPTVRYSTFCVASSTSTPAWVCSSMTDMQWCLAAVAWGVWPSRSNVLLTTAPALISASTAAVCQFSPMTLISVVTRVHAGLQQSADNGGVPELSGVNRELKFVSLSTGPLAW